MTVILLYFRPRFVVHNDRNYVISPAGGVSEPAIPTHARALLFDFRLIFYFAYLIFNIFIYIQGVKAQNCVVFYPQR